MRRDTHTRRHRERNVSRVMENITKWNSFKVYIGIWALNEFSAWKTHAIIHRQMRTVTNEQKQMAAKCMVVYTYTYTARYTFVDEQTTYVWTNGRHYTNQSSGRTCMTEVEREKSQKESRGCTDCTDCGPIFPVLLLFVFPFFLFLLGTLARNKKRLRC